MMSGLTIILYHIQSESESPDHDADDYEEMEHAMRRDSFVEEGPEDVYQNQ